MFHAVVLVFVPEAATLTGEEWAAADAIVAGVLAGRSASVRRQVGLFLLFVNLLALLKYGRPLATLALDRRTHLLDALGRSRLLLLRRGVFGLRTLAFMAYYARPEAALMIGYRASAAGWGARRQPVPR